MSRLAITFLVMSCLTASTASQQRVFRGGVDTVVVDVSVTSGNRPVANLTAADFEVLDNNERQTIVDISYEAQAIDVTLVVDASGSVTGVLLTALQRALRDVAGSLRPGDRARVVTFNHRVREVVALTEAATIGPDTISIAAGGQTSLFDALAVSLVTAPAPGRRQMAILFTDGRDTLSLTDETAVVEVARRSEPAIFVVAATAGSGSFPMAPPHERLFRTLTEATGGHLVVLRRDQNLSSSFLRAIEDFRSSYVIRYTLRSDVREGWHDIAVRVTRPGRYDIRARRGYFGG